MMALTLLAFAFGVGWAAPNDGDIVWQKPLPTSECGPDHGYAACNPGQCCSKYGWCGATDQHCNEESFWISPEKQAQLSGRHFNGIPLNEHPAITPESAQITRKSVQQDPDFKVLAQNRAVLPAMDWCGPGKFVALTFDDGPFTNGVTEAILDDLASLDMKATFFLAPHGAAGASYRNPAGQCALVKRMLKDGHSIAGHTMTHPDLLTLAYSDVKHEIEGSNAWYKDCTGTDLKVQTVRPPFGNLNRGLRDYINSLGVTVVTWNVDSRDWADGQTTSKIFEKTTKDFEALPKGSSMILLHHDLHYIPGKGKGLLPQYKEYFSRIGYEFVNLDKCMKSCMATNSCSMGGDIWPGVYN